ncbi:class A beta-lactamase [Rubrivivax benzoatilyticus]|uniref:Beta-lactamase n=1 Tax=Rubrivivax benzoatilyticus TaxID=316997 RepID=A0ABX0HYV3_9BURK|nr:class A beta-lactamase [Rubrivivax benzoatilyticus]EGJ11656.1 beta-lactamase [Rubrivivax benzoatilyticus JA2 = ATCC BAA-35]NHL00191.1 class A beta-lactamase [Rubrivivax benzoatilyticus]NHL26030.1 class A beta-lactamase [Rubrivivax benzoatilyticus]
MKRRSFHAWAALTLAVAGRPALALEAGDADAFGAIERSVAGRLGVCAYDLETGRSLGHRQDERFAMCSTFKWLLAAAVLARVDRGQERLERRIVFGREALLEYAPTTSRHAGGAGMTVAELCEAALTLSDNTAANLLLDTLGGPGGLTAWVRTLGDRTTRLDRREPDLNEARPGDERDTTTPAAMVLALRQAVFGGALSRRGGDLLLQWMTASTTGLKRLRAGFPPDWRVADKTGTGAQGTTHDVAVVWAPGRAPLLLAAYLTESQAPIEAREAALARVAARVKLGLIG